MWLYLIIFLIPVYFFYSNNKKCSGNSMQFLICYVILLCIFVGISDMFGGFDRYIYGELFDNVADNIRGGDLYSSYIFEEYPKEVGYDYLNVLIALFTANRYIFILILTIIIYILVFISFKRYMNNYPYAMILFMSLFFFFTFTYLRQILAVSISWLSIKYIIDRKFWKFACIIIIAFLFHNSAIIALPFYFLPVRKFKVQSILIVMFLCLLLGITGITGSLYDAYGGMSDSEERAAKYADEGGFRIAYLVEAFFFLYLILRNYKDIPNDKGRLVLCNMSLTFCGILLFFIKSDNGGRLSWFYMIGLISTLTYIISYNRIKKDMAIFMIFVSLFLYVRIYSSWQVYMNLYPYKTFFTNGYRKGDYTWINYEYDHGYDRDKFYR